MKRSFTKSSIVVCILCVLTFTMLCACNKNSDDNLSYDVTYFDNNKSDGISFHSDFVEKIVEFNQLIEFCNNKKMSINDKNDFDYDCDLYKQFRSYDKKFFRTKSLLVVGKHMSEGFWDFEFGNLKIKDNSLIINILCNDEEPDYEHEQLPCEETQYIWVIEVNKKSIENISQLVVQEYRIIV